jgi:hypothetical protein
LPWWQFSAHSIADRDSLPGSKARDVLMTVEEMEEVLASEPAGV